MDSVLGRKSAKCSVGVVLLDLDNTLYDWLGFFGPAMRGLCTRLGELSGVSASILYDDFKTVFSAHGSVEYTFALQELPSLRRLHPESSGPEIVHQYFGAVELYQSRRRRYLRLYGGVRSGIQAIRSLGIRVVAVSDAHRFHVVNRLKQLRIIDELDAVCCVPDLPGIDAAEISAIRRFPSERYSTTAAWELPLPAGIRKPDPHLLRWLLSELEVAPELTLYVGDSLLKDIPMAQQADVYDCWAAYGTHYSPLDMATLVRVTNWPPKAVEAALNATPEKLGIHPNSTALCFADVLDLVTTPREKWPRGAHSSTPHTQLAFDFGAEASTA